MRTLLVMFCITIALVSCGPKYGSVTGNVYWKYNNYVGNKPDAGSIAYLYPYNKSSKPIEATADIQGNFRFDKAETGDYLLLVVSKNTTDSPEDHYHEIKLSSAYLRDVFNFEVSKILPDKQKEFHIRDSILLNFQITDKSSISGDFLKHMDQVRKKKDTLRTVAEEIIKAIPSDIVMKLGILTSYGSKIKIKKIKVEADRSTNEVFDFGVTFM